METPSAELTRLLKSQGASLVGFADLRELNAETREGLPHGIAIVVALDPRVIPGIADGPTSDYHREYRAANDKLARLGDTAAGFLRQQGYRAVVLHPTVGEDKATLSTILPHKTVATRAGIGWIGKCALLVTPELGSDVRLVSVLTDAPVETGVSTDTSRCGDCSICTDACPAGAVMGENWQAGVSREALVDVHRCRETARELFFQTFGKQVSICGRCIVVCPWTIKYLDKSQSPD